MQITCKMMEMDEIVYIRIISIFIELKNIILFMGMRCMYVYVYKDDGHMNIQNSYSFL